MCEVVEISDDEDASAPENFVKLPEDEDVHFGFPVQRTCLGPREEDVPSSSGSDWRSFFAGMGFPPSLVNKVIEENGDECAEVLLEALLAQSNLQQPKEEPCDDGESSGRKNGWMPKEEPEDLCGVMDENISSLIRMNFSLNEVRVAMDRLGKYASLSQLKDSIIAARMGQKYTVNGGSALGSEKSEMNGCTEEALFNVMDKTLQLLDMGFPECQISTAFDLCGFEASVEQLATSIVAPDAAVNADKFYNDPKMGNHFPRQPWEFYVKKEEFDSGVASEIGASDLVETPKGKMTTKAGTDNSKRKKPRMEPMDEPMWQEEQKNIIPAIINEENFWRQTVDTKPTLLPPNPSRSLSSMVSKRPYFVYGSTSDLPQISWTKVSQFLYSIQPEFADTRQFSALHRIEGYVHNLPTEDRFHISPKGPTSIEEAIPSARKWWPSWDRRKHILHTQCDSTGLSHLCDKIGRILAECEGHPSAEQQRSLLLQIESKNLIWLGNYKMSPLEPEQLERIMGYPLHHSQVSGFSSAERLKSLKMSFQTDTLGYHLSILKCLFPEGVSVLSFFTGMGGAEVALQRLGIRLKGLVSIEPSEARRRVLKKWWENSGQKGKLIQLEDIQKLSGTKLENLSENFAGFDLVFCQNPCSDSSVFNFSEFMEFVRVFQRLKSTMDRNS